jgi:hypothetical protein
MQLIDDYDTWRFQRSQQLIDNGIIQDRKLILAVYLTYIRGFGPIYRSCWVHSVWVVESGMHDTSSAVNTITRTENGMLGYQID